MVPMLVLSCLAWLGLVESPPALRDGLATVAERSGFRETSRNAEVIEFVSELERRAATVQRLSFGVTVEQRPIAAAVLAQPPISTPAQAQASRKLVVLLLGNIHSGECDGKEALLALARDLANQPDNPLLKQLILVVVPNFNADGNERMAPDNRPGQVGPDTMGRRENAQGLDLNRDFVKLETPEVQALVRFLNAWNPHVFIDCHTTNGSRHRYPLTFAAPHNLAAAEAPRTFTRDQLLEQVRQRLEARGVSTFSYGNFNREHTRWSTYGHEPRYGIEYVGLRGRISILAESYSYRSYQERIEATRSFLGECLGYLAEHAPEVIRTLDDAARHSVAAGLNPTPDDRVAVRARLAALPDKVVVKGFEPAPRTANPNGQVSPPRNNDPPKDYSVEHVDRCEATFEVTRPFAYVIPGDQSRIADNLAQHGIAIDRLTRATSCETVVYRIATLEKAPQPFQAHRLETATVNPHTERRELPASSFVIRTAQPLGNLAIYLLEPASDDGLLTWGFWDSRIELNQDYPVLRIDKPTELPTESVAQVAPTQKLDLDQIYGPARPVVFGGSTAPPPRWLPGRHEFLERSDNRLLATTAPDMRSRPFLDPTRMEKALAAIPGISQQDARAIAGQTNLELNKDASAALIAHANDLYLYRIDSGEASRLSNSPEPEEHASFSPDGKSVAFVRKHNLFVIELASAQERALTTDGNERLLFGELDWIYQEELYGRGQFRAYWWSPNSTQIALLRLDESAVKPFTVVDHLPVRQELEVTPYPKAGDPNPKAALGVVNVTGGPIHWVDTSTYDSSELLLVRVGWTPDGRQVVFQVQNREQTWLDLVTVEPGDNSLHKLLREQSEGWVEVLGEPHWLRDGSFLWLSDRSGARHIYRVSTDGTQITPLTSGTWDVDEVQGVDQEHSWVYFTATKEGTGSMHAYRVHLDGTGMQRLTDRPGNHAVAWDQSFSFFLDTWSDVDTPPQTWLCAADGSRLHAVQPNLVDQLRHYRLNRPEFLQVPARDRFPLDAMLIKPPDFDSHRKYPVLCYVYSGPQHASVRNRWGAQTYIWHQMLAQHGYVIWICDNRSASTKGIAAALPIHKQLGRHELEDIEDGVAWLKAQPWVDGERIGIWGWSYGGYMTSYALTHSTSFKIGIAGAPVTDWRNYDSIYTERYMGLPQDNPDGYRDSSPLLAADRLHGRLLLLHATTDDNVHLTNTLQLVHALQKAGKQFDLMLYPKNRHGVTDAHQLRHMRELMTRFVFENL